MCYVTKVTSAVFPFPFYDHEIVNIIRIIDECLAMSWKDSLLQV